MAATILDVIDNFFGSEPDLAHVSGRRLTDFGDEVRRWTTAFEPPVVEPGSRPTYVGGWPSANVWDAASGQLALVPLLYVGQLVGRDPISDWYNPDRYAVETLLAARPGYLDPETGTENIGATRAFLARVIPALEQLRPLIASGAILLAPYRSFLVQQSDRIHMARDDLLARVLPDDVNEFCRRFQPGDLAVEDNVRGLFVFAGGEQAAQVTKMVARSLEFFVAEYLFARSIGAEYAAPFPYEQYLCTEGVEPSLLDAPGARVVHALLRSELPLFERLSPHVLAQVREDEAFGTFRASLFELYRDIPTSSDDEAARAIAEVEQTLLGPALERVRRESDRGLLGRAGLRIAGPALRMATAIGIDVATGTEPQLAIAKGSLNQALSGIGRPRRRDTPDRIWTRLYAHHREVTDEIPSRRVSTSGPVGGDAYWGIPDTPSMSVTVSSGILVAEHLAPARIPRAVGRNDRCPCRSGRKYKVCCLPR